MTSAHAGQGSFVDPATLTVDLDYKNYSAACKRLASQLRDRHGIELTHTQARTVMASTLGFDSPNHLDALLKEKKSREQIVHNGIGGRIVDEWPDLEDDESHMARRTRQATIQAKLSGLIESYPVDVVSCFVDLTISTLAKRHPPALSSAEKEVIQANVIDVTDDLIAERAMSDEGLMYAITLAGQLARIAIDYSPQSFTKDVERSDGENGKAAGQRITKAVPDIFSGAMQSGLSPYGVAATTILCSIHAAMELGVKWQALIKLLLEAIEFASSRGITQAKRSSLDQSELDERFIQMVMEQMGVSRSTAKKYLAEAKNMLKEEQ